MVVKNQFGCADTATAEMAVNGLPDAAFTNSLACMGKQTYFFDASGTFVAPLDLWGWHISDSLGMVGNMDGGTPTYLFDNVGRYMVMLTVADTNGCTDTIVQSVNVAPAPTSVFSYSENVDNVQGKISFVNGSSGAKTYFWDFGNGDTSIDDSPTITYTEDGDYQVLLVSVSKEGCHDTASIEYKMLFKGLYVPNAFAPGGTIQETRAWLPVGVNLASYHAQVYNRQGMMLWESSQLDDKGTPSESWDGNYKGKPCQQGVYVWKITAVYRDGSIWENTDVGNHTGMPEVKQGTVALIR
jgi:hypothetical protein